MSSPRILAQWGLLGLAALSFGCASGGAPQPETRSEAVAPPVQPEPPAEPIEEVEPVAAEPPAPEQAEETGAYGPKTVVIESPEPEQDTEPTLAEAARLARERRAEEGAPIAVITDETLPEYATGELSEAAVEPTKSASTTEEAEQGAEEERGEDYWRSRVRDARIEWRDLMEELARLEQEAGDLRTRFYAEDDGFYRDSQIKPAWDRALDRLGEVRDRLPVARQNVQDILQEGRLAGALPGWLREGIEYEPSTEESKKELDIHEVSEPNVIDETDDGDGDR